MSNQEATDVLLERFEAADDDGKIEIYLEALRKGSINEESAFVCLNALHQIAIARDERARFVEWVRLLADEYPELYEQEIIYYHSWLMQDLASEGLTNQLPELFSVYEDLTAADMELFFRDVDLMLYHGFTSELLEIMVGAWENLAEDGDVDSYAMSDFGEIISSLIIFDYVECTNNPRGDDPQLMERLEPYYQADDEWLQRTVAHLSGQAERQWLPSDFALSVNSDTWGDNMFFLSLDFVGELHRRVGVPMCRAELARAEFQAYATERYESLRKSNDETSVEKLFRPQRHKLDRYLGKLVTFLSAQPYKAGAMLELLPEYIQFLARQGLIATEEIDKTMVRLRPLAYNLRRVLEGYGSDAVLLANLAASWQMED